ncbi:hypothetical protein HanPSC8_Chr04g0152341 [Helianthus annuus]|nr:hypothetical protein HanPSC8_Chr04g0152341 [Helianthus annuus]
MFNVFVMCQDNVMLIFSIKRNSLCIHGCETIILLQHSPTFPPRFCCFNAVGV